MIDQTMDIIDRNIIDMFKDIIRITSVNQAFIHNILVYKDQLSKNMSLKMKRMKDFFNERGDMNFSIYLNKIEHMLEKNQIILNYINKAINSANIIQFGDKHDTMYVTDYLIDMRAFMREQIEKQICVIMENI